MPFITSREILLTVFESYLCDLLSYRDQIRHQLATRTSKCASQVLYLCLQFRYPTLALTLTPKRTSLTSDAINNTRHEIIHTRRTSCVLSLKFRYIVTEVGTRMQR